MTIEYRTEPYNSRDGLSSFLGILMTEDDSFGLGVEELNEPLFFNEVYDEHVYPAFEKASDEWKKLIVDGIEYGIGLSFEEIDTMWSGMMGQYNLHEDQWIDFFREIRRKLREDFAEFL